MVHIPHYVVSAVQFKPPHEADWLRGTLDQMQFQCRCGKFVFIVHTLPSVEGIQHVWLIMVFIHLTLEHITTLVLGL